MIGSKRVWTGITDENPEVVDPNGDFKFLDGTRAIIKRYNDVDPSDEEDVILKWGGPKLPDNAGLAENCVEVYRDSGQHFLNDLRSDITDRYAFCEKIKPECLKGIYILISCEFL